MTETAKSDAVASTEAKKTTAKKNETRGKRDVRRPLGAKRASAEPLELKAYLASIGHPTEPKIHVNGAQFPNCVLTVDFGQPSKVNKLPSEHVGELVAHLRKAARDIMNRDVTVRVSNDSHTGIWWVTVN